MYPFTDYTTTKKYSAGKNPSKYLILHHTWGGDYKSNIKYLTTSTAQASVHFIIWENEECCKCFENEPKIMWHAWQSSWWNLTWMNKYSIWIEVVGYWEYNTKQLIRLTDLVEYLMYNFNIPRENILRHCDLTWAGSTSKKLWDWKSKSRKVDISPDFFPMWFETRRNQLKPRKESRYK